MATDVSSVVNHFPEAQNGFSTTLASTTGSGATTVALNSIGSYANGKPVVLVVDPTDASKKQTFTGIVDTANTQITNVVWTAGTNQSHSGGATVVDYFTATVVDMIVKGILVEHGQDGKHDAVTADSLVIADGGNIEADHILEAATGHGVVIDGFSIKDNMPKNWDGWINPDETWTYASASTFTVTGNQTAKYTKGTRLKFTQTTVKYAVVVSSAYTSSTTVTIAVNTDYTIANAAITANCYSYMANPQGYPTEFAFTPAYAKLTEGSGTNTGFYSVVGGMVHFRTKWVYGAGASVSGNITLTLPITIKPGVDGFIGIAHLYDNGSAAYHGFVGVGGAITGQLSSAAYTSNSDTSGSIPFTWTTNDAFSLNGSYPMA